MKYSKVVSLILVGIMVLMMAACGAASDKVSEAITPSKASNESKSSKSEDEIVDALMALTAEKYGTSPEAYAEILEADGKTPYETFKLAADTMGISLQELYEYESGAVANLTPEQKETLAAMGSALEEIGDLDLTEVDENTAEELLGINSNTSGEIRVVEGDFSQLLSYKVKEYSENYVDEYSIVSVYTSDADMEELIEYYDELILNTEDYMKIEAAGEGALIQGTINTCPVVIEVYSESGVVEVYTYVDTITTGYLVEGQDVDEESDEGSPVDDSDTSVIVGDISGLNPLSEFYLEIEGTATNQGETIPLFFKVFFQDRNVRIETSWYDQMIGTSVYNTDVDATYTELLMGTHYGELLEGNYLPIQLLSPEFIEQLEIDNETELFTAHYEDHNGEQVLYVMSSMKYGVTTERWYSLDLLVPIKYREVTVEEGITEETNWEVTYIDVSSFDAEGMFDIPDDGYHNEITEDDEAIRDILLYDVTEMDVDEKGIDSMTQILYYSQSDYEDIVAYFISVLEGTDGYFLMPGDEMTSVDGTINNNTVMIIINNYKETEEGFDMNGVNVNYFLNW